MSVDDIVAEARLSVGGFYRRFTNKDHLIRNVMKRAMIRDLEKFTIITAPEVWAEVATRTMIRALLTVVIGEYATRKNMVAAAMIGGARDNEAWAEVIDLRKELNDRIVALMLQRRGEMSHAYPEQACPLLIQAIFALLNERTFYQGHFEIDLGHMVLRDELERLMTSFLGIP
jgi:AcrR family transcriptional regulator